MIKNIIQKFIKNGEKVTDKNVRQDYIRLSGIMGIIGNLVIFAAKLAIGLLINSIAVISDAFNNLSDVGSAIIAILSAKLSTQQPDKNHPHGHGRFEYIGSLVMAFIILSVGLELLRKSYDRLINPERVDFSTAILAILILSVLIKLWMFSYNLYIANKIKSSINKAAAYDSLNDSIATSLVIVSMIIGSFTDLPIDGAVGLIIALLIMYSGFDVAKDTVSLLLGSAPDPQVISKINQIVASGQYVLRVHDLEIHDYGPGQIDASIHAEVPDYINIVEAHLSIDKLERQVRDETGILLTIHIDPVSTDTVKIKKIQEEITSCLDQAEIHIQIQSFRIAEAPDRIIIFLGVKSFDKVPNEEHEKIKKDIRSVVEKTYSNYEIVIDRFSKEEG